jgi:hypothetical protein
VPASAAGRVGHARRSGHRPSRARFSSSTFTPGSPRNPH